MGQFQTVVFAGWGLGVEKWQREFRDSRVCPVILGDSPHHTLIRSIRVHPPNIILTNVGLRH